MPNGVGTLQVAQPQIGTVSRQPQTATAPGAVGSTPFNRLSRKMQIPGPNESGKAFGALWTPLLKPVGGYLRRMPFHVIADGGSGSGGASLSADGPYNAIQQLQFRDPFGTVIIQADGYSLYLVNLYSAQVGMLGFGNSPSALPSWSAISATTGEFAFTLVLPFELDSSGYCSLATMNASSQPQVQVQLNAAATVYATEPSSTTPTLQLVLNEEFWGVPIDHPNIAPPDVGSSSQWSVTRAQGGVQSGAYQRLQLNRVGTWIHTLILVLRDADGVRIDAWPLQDLTLWVDGIPLIQEWFDEREDIMYTAFGVTRPTGVLVYTFRDSVQTAVGLADTYDNLLPTTPATLLEIGGTFQTISSAPAYITVITGELYPYKGIPYNHLAG